MYKYSVLVLNSNDGLHLFRTSVPGSNAGLNIMTVNIALGIGVEKDLVVSSHLRVLSDNSIHRRSQSAYGKHEAIM